jgi:thioester reductase-like protein
MASNLTFPYHFFCLTQFKRMLGQSESDRSGHEAFTKLAQRKLAVIAGDMTVPSLGIGADDLTLLRTTVNVVLHCAASVDFNEPLGQAVQLNIVGEYLRS